MRRVSVLAILALVVIVVPGRTQIVINEIMQNPDAVTDANGEWLELYNAGDEGVDINGWAIIDLGTDDHVIDNGGPLIIPAEGYLVLGRNANQEENGGVAVDYEYSGFSLGNTDDEIILLDGDSVEVDRVEYDGGPLFPDPAGASMELTHPGLDNNVGANWHVAATPFGDGDLGTPGGPNSVPLTITTSSLPPGTVGEAYDAALTAVGGVLPYTWGLSSGSLPQGLSLSSDGLISGTPAVPDTQVFTVQVTDAEENEDTQDLTLMISVAQPTETILETFRPAYRPPANPEPCDTLHEICPVRCRLWHVRRWDKESDSSGTAELEFPVGSGDVQSYGFTDVVIMTVVDLGSPADTLRVELEDAFRAMLPPLVSTQWHELWPFYCRRWHMDEWYDNGDGELSPCDTVVLSLKPARVVTFTGHVIAVATGARLSEPGCEGGERGDVNGDGTINVVDCLAVVNHILDIDPLTDEGALCRADCKKDGVINVLDVLAIVRVILGEIPDCGSAACRAELTSGVEAFLKASVKPHLSAGEYAELVALAKGQRGVPIEYDLSQNYPNPFNPSTTIVYTLPHGERNTENGGRGPFHTSLKIYNLLGQEVKTLVEGIQEPGYYTVTWDGRDAVGQDAASGIYFYRLTIGDLIAARRMVLLR